MIVMDENLMDESKLSEELIKRARVMRIQSVRTATSIGLLIMQFNRLEQSLGELLAVFLKRERQDNFFENIDIMTAALSFGQKLDLLSALYLKRYQKLTKQCHVFQKIIHQLSKFEEYRNKYVHSRWGIRTVSDAEFKRFKPKIKGRKGLKQDADPTDWRQIRTIYKEMQEFDCIELLEIYRGCVEYEAMSEEMINKLNDRLTTSSN